MDYFFGQPNFFAKVKIIVSSFFGFLLCASSFRVPMQKQNQNTVYETVPFSISGLKTLISSEEDHQDDGEEILEDRVIRSAGIGIIRSNFLTRSSSFCSSRSWNLFMDDLIGTESGVYLTSDTEEIEDKFSPSGFNRRHNRTNHHDFTAQKQRCASKMQFPPPIPFLAVKAGLRPRSPWILTRYCSNKRLVLKLERVTHHQSLESHRENGRLILNLVPATVPEVDNEDVESIEEEEGNEEIETIECDEGRGDGEIGFKSFTYGEEGVGGGMMCCVVNGKFEERHVVHEHFGSAPLRPMGTVM